MSCIIQMCACLNSWTYIFMNLKLRACLFDLCWHLLRDGICGAIKAQSPSLGTREIGTVPQWTLRKRTGHIPINRVYLQNWMESLLKDFTICPQRSTTPLCFYNSSHVSPTPASLILISSGKFAFFTKMLHLYRKGVPRSRPGTTGLGVVIHKGLQQWEFFLLVFLLWDFHELL